jgi:hypothetical protein
MTFSAGGGDLPSALGVHGGESSYTDRKGDTMPNRVLSELSYSDHALLSEVHDAGRQARPAGVITTIPGGSA